MHVAGRHEVAPSGRASVRADHFRNQLWVIPACFGIGALVLAVVLARVDALHDLVGDIGYLGDRNSAQITLATIAAAMLTFLGLVFSITVLALQLASNQFSPRVLRVFQRDRKTQVVLGIFLGTFVFSLTSIAELGEQRVHAAPVLVGVAFLLVGASLLAFIAYLQHITWNLRAVAIIEAIAAETRGVIAHSAAQRPAVAGPAAFVPTGRAIILTSSTSGVIAAVDLARLIRRAQDLDAYVRVLRPVGGYVSFGEPVIEVFTASEVDAHALMGTVDIAPSRTMFQDVGFGLRQLVDIAERALSPAVNDPTTALQALDRIGDLLGRLALQPDPPSVFHDDAGAPRVEWVPESWDSLVDLGFNEIRWFGQQCVQVTRRMASIIDYLLAIAPTDRHPPLLEARARLEEVVALGLPESLRDHALLPDALGIGGRA